MPGSQAGEENHQLLHGALLAIPAITENAAATAGATLAHLQPDPDEGMLPSVHNADAVADAEWFADRPYRLFRARFGDGGIGTWIIRRRRQGSDPDVLLRTFARTPVQNDTDGELTRIWFAT